MTINPGPSAGLVRRRQAYVVLMLCCSSFPLWCAQTAAKESLEFYKPPSPCLMGASCRNCVHTVHFYHYQVCCYHCRLDNIIINHHLCHCIDTRLPESTTDMGGNCSSGALCDNCAVKISADVSEDMEATPGVPSFCCQDCGLVRPYLSRDEQGCHCHGDSEGVEHQVVPKYDPSQHSTTSWPALSSATRPIISSLSLIAPLLCVVCFLQ